MSENDTIETTETPNPNAELRAYADRLKEENAQLRKDVMATRLEAVGLSVDAGLGKAVAKEYDGVLSPDAIATYLSEEYGYVPDESTVNPELVQEASDRVEKVMERSTPVTPEQPVDPAEVADRRLGEPDSGRTDAQSAIQAKLNALGT